MIILNDEQLAELKAIELSMLKNFIYICDQLKLNYYVIGGTLLGAVRHQGFIPWDDDIDIGMLREDYEKFIKYGAQYLEKDYFIQTFNTDPEYPLNFAKLRNSNTTFVEYSLKNRKINHGVYIDIFPLDYYPEKQITIFKIRKLLMTLRVNCIYPNKSKKIKTRIVRLISRFLYPSLSKTVQKKELLFKSFTSGNLIASHCGAWGAKEIMPAEWFFETTTLNFEGLKVSAPKEYNLYLTQLYGDYMTPPPLEKQVPHHYVEAIDLHNSYSKTYP